ncbi:MAG: PilZ domain-containing protein [Bdellovibrionota bacterium]
MQQQAHYFLSPVLIYDNSGLKVAMTRALVSRQGIYKVFEDTAEARNAFLAGRCFRVRIDGTEFSACLVRESGPSGTHFNLRLVHDSIESEVRIGGLLDRFGFESPWKRDFARIPAGLEGREVPVEALLERPAGLEPASVRDFSCQGLFLEQRGAEFLPEDVGQRVRFRLLTSEGRVLDPGTARIARVYEEWGAGGALNRGLGMQIIMLPDAARRIYHAMILESWSGEKDGKNVENILTKKIY